MPNVTASLDSVRLKLLGADKHFHSIVELLDGFSIGQVELIAEEDKDTHTGFLRVHLPKPPDELSLMVADFLFNIRSALDHLVWQLVLANTPNTPNGKTAFPICSSLKNFEDAKKRKRLDGVSENARALIESFQPYDGRNQTLRTLSTLHETDKHQTFNLVTAVASDTFIDWISGDISELQMFLGGEELRDGSIFGGIGMPLDNPELLSLIGSRETLAGFRERYLKIKVLGQAAIFVAFDDTEAEELEPLRVEALLKEILEFVWDQIIPAFEPFFD
jgi:hypothetical protein